VFRIFIIAIGHKFGNVLIEITWTAYW